MSGTWSDRAGAAADRARDATRELRWWWADVPAKLKVGAVGAVVLALAGAVGVLWAGGNRDTGSRDVRARLEAAGAALAYDFEGAAGVLDPELVRHMDDAGEDGIVGTVGLADGDGTCWAFDVRIDPRWFETGASTHVHVGPVAARPASTCQP